MFSCVEGSGFFCFLFPTVIDRLARVMIEVSSFPGAPTLHPVRHNAAAMRIKYCRTYSLT
jgi:hypothetical protein